MEPPDAAGIPPEGGGGKSSNSDNEGIMNHVASPRSPSHARSTQSSRGDTRRRMIIPIATRFDTTMSKRVTQTTEMPTALASEAPVAARTSTPVPANGTPDALLLRATSGIVPSNEHEQQRCDHVSVRPFD